MLWIVACAPAPEPLDLPADLAAAGVPVGVTTLEHDGTTLEVWYPASDDATGLPAEDVDWEQFVPAVFTDRVGEAAIPPVPTSARRDAALRVPEAPYPVVVFSHGFGGVRLQSSDLTVHLASRGYVVVAPDHPSRWLPGLLPCLFSPPLEGCDLSGFGGENGAAQIAAAAAWAEHAAVERKGVFEGALDLEHMGLVGHSAGGGTTVDVGEVDTRFDVLLPMAGGGPVTRDVPTLVMGGTCDAYADETALVETGEDLALLHGAGHLAFSDICELDLGTLAEDLLVGRDDVNDTLLDGLLGLATDGCPGYAPQVDHPDCEGGYLDLAESDPAIRHVATGWLDQHLRGGPTVDGSGYSFVELRP